MASLNPSRTRRAGLLGLATASMAFFGTTNAPVAQDFDVNAVLWCEGRPIGNQTKEDCEAARTIIFQSCTACHSFVPIVKQQRDAAGWDAFIQRHIERAPELSQEQWTQLGDFLKAHFNPDNPVPVLPPELEALSDLPPA